MIVGLGGRDHGPQDQLLWTLGAPNDFKMGLQWGSNGGDGEKQFKCVFGFSCIFDNMLWYFWGFNYSKMANEWFLMDSNTF